MSFTVNMDTGGFHCFGCDAKGGDVLAFVMLRDNVPFKRAAQLLGAWRDESLSVHERQRIASERANRERERVAERARIEAELQNRISVRDELHQLERDYSRASARLTQIHHGAQPRYRGEENLAWWFLSDTLPRIREAEANYYRLAGLETN